ncbi:hypothetical protein FRB99_007390 [Tulasnella sp. 403]|nr:hypothetical protein FRB99_007390 [Tulasnella sp. 403]
MSTSPVTSNHPSPSASAPEPTSATTAPASVGQSQPQQGVPGPVSAAISSQADVAASHVPQPPLAIPNLQTLPRHARVHSLPSHPTPLPQNGGITPPLTTQWGANRVAPHLPTHVSPLISMPHPTHAFMHHIVPHQIPPPTSSNSRARRAPRTKPLPINCVYLIPDASATSFTGPLKHACASTGLSKPIDLYWDMTSAEVSQAINLAFGAVVDLEAYSYEWLEISRDTGPLLRPTNIGSNPNGFAISKVYQRKTLVILRLTHTAHVPLFDVHLVRAANARNGKPLGDVDSESIGDDSGAIFTCPTCYQEFPLTRCTPHSRKCPALQPANRKRALSSSSLRGRSSSVPLESPRKTRASKKAKCQQASSDGEMEPQPQVRPCRIRLKLSTECNEGVVGTPDSNSTCGSQEAPGPSKEGFTEDDMESEAGDDKECTETEEIRLCPFCDFQLPPNISDRFFHAAAAAKVYGTAAPTSLNPDHVDLDLVRMSAICSIHEHERAAFVDINKGFPSTIDFGILPSRIRALRSKLQAMLDGPSEHTVIETLRHKPYLSQRDRNAAMAECHAGYYGEHPTKLDAFGN